MGRCLQSLCSVAAPDGCGQQFQLLSSSDRSKNRASANVSSRTCLLRIDVMRAHSFMGDDLIQVSFSTPSAYFDALDHSKASIPRYQADLLPYADGKNSYWTGYFGSRPILKSLVRQAGAALHSADTLYVLCRAVVVGRYGISLWADASRRWFDILVECRRAVALAQAAGSLN